MNDSISTFQILLNNLDTSVNIIKLTSESYLNYILTDTQIQDDLLVLICNKFREDKDHTNTLAIIYLLNDIIQKIAKNDNKQDSSLKILELMKYISRELNLHPNEKSEKLNSEIARIVKIWIDKNILEEEKLFDLKLLSTNYLDYELNCLDDIMLRKLIEKGEIKEINKVFSYSKYLNDHNTKAEEIESIHHSIVSEQMEISKKHINMLSDIDSLLSKLNMIK